MTQGALAAEIIQKYARNTVAEVAGGCSFGPYQYVPEGVYKVTIAGEKLSALNLDCYYIRSAKQSFIDMIELQKTDELITFFIDSYDGLPMTEILLNNPSGEDVIVKSITIECMTD